MGDVNVCAWSVACSHVSHKKYKKIKTTTRENEYVCCVHGTWYKSNGIAGYISSQDNKRYL